MSQSPLLSVNEVSKSFGALRAVDGVSFSVSEGEILGVAGPNGSGKSTLFNIITGIPFRPDRGEVIYRGQAIQNFSPNRIAQAGLARTFQRETDFETLTTHQNVELATRFGARNEGMKPSDALEFCGITADQYERPAGELSVFDKKRLMVATAIAMEPDILLMDEPASGLTKPEVDETADLITRLNDRGITIILIEHVLTLLLNVSQRLVVLNEGQVLATGLPAEVIKDEAVIEAYLGSKGRDAAAS